jgi:hypothetical protein
MVFSIPDRGYFQWCTGTLIAENVFLTASHCTFDVDIFLERFPGSEMLVTFDSTIHEGGTFYAGTLHTNPAYNNFSGPGGNPIRATSPSSSSTKRPASPPPPCPPPACSTSCTRPRAAPHSLHRRRLRHHP